MIYGEKQAGQYDGDYIIETDDYTYIGRLKPGYPRTQNSPAVTSQNVWQIERIETQELVPNQNEPDVKEYHTTRKYPDGRLEYDYAIDNAASYNYDFRH